MWSVDALIAEIAVRRPHFIAMSRLLADRAYRVSQLRDWLAAEPAYGALTADDIETLSNDPPLPFFILFEAMQQPQAEGLHLGPLGSIIVSEVIFGALADDPRLGRTGAASLAEAARRISANIIRQMFLQKFPKSNAWINWSSSPPKSATCSRPCPHFCEAELFRLTQPGGVKTCAIERLQVTNHERWGKLVKTWATGKNYLDDDNDYPLPETMDEFKEQLAKAQVFATVPDRFKQIKFVASGAGYDHWCGCRRR